MKMNRRDLIKLLGLSSASVFLPTEAFGFGLLEFKTIPDRMVMDLTVVGISNRSPGHAGHVALWVHGEKLIELVCAEYGGMSRWIPPAHWRPILDELPVRLTRRGEVEAVLTLLGPSGQLELITTVEEE